MPNAAPLTTQGLTDMAGTSEDPGTQKTRGEIPVPQAQRRTQAADTSELPGDAVCWLRLVCTECGAIAESEPPANCPQCGALLEAGR
jgi:rubrerythrin